MTDSDDAVAVALSRLGIASSELPAEILEVITAHLNGNAMPGGPNMNDLLRGRDSGSPGTTPGNDAPVDEPAALELLKLQVAEHYNIPQLAGDLQGHDLASLSTNAEWLLETLRRAEPPVPTTNVPSGARGTEHELSGAEQVNAMLRAASGRDF